MDDRIPIPNATRSIVFGILAFPASCITAIPVIGTFIGPFLSAVLAFAGLAAGVQALLLLNREPDEYKGMPQAVVGTVISVIASIIFGGLALMVLLSLVFGVGAGLLDSVL